VFFCAHKGLRGVVTVQLGVVNQAVGPHLGLPYGTSL
jgi:hypothetical protein